MTQDPNIDSRLGKYPTDVKLLLCQLVQDAKEESTWQDVYERFTNHPIVLRLYKEESKSIRDIPLEELPALVVDIINDTVAKDKTREEAPVKMPRGRRPNHTVAPPFTPSMGPNDESVDSVDNFNSFNSVVSFDSVDSIDSVDLSLFRADSGAREALSLCCSRLHGAAVAAIRRQLAARRREFALQLGALT